MGPIGKRVIRVALVVLLALVATAVSISAWRDQATLVVDPPPAHDGNSSVTITAGSSQCLTATAVQVWSIFRNTRPPDVPTERFTIETWLSDNGGPLTVSLAFKSGQLIQGRCEWTFERLPPGDYVALLIAPSGSGGSQVFSITDNRPATVVIAAPEVRLSGHVTRNGEPVARTHVRILSFPFSRPAVVVLTDVQGRYSATIDRPGLNRVDAHGVGMVESELASGTNVVNIPGKAAQ